jgi:CheY-like chemotaxis protein
MKKILWIEDDYFHIQALFRQVERKGYSIEYALTALAGYELCKNTEEYHLIVVDVILPLANPDDRIDDIVAGWGKERYPGIGLIKWLVYIRKPDCPVVILTVVSELVGQLYELGTKAVISKASLGPSALLEQVSGLLRDEETRRGG